MSLDSTLKKLPFDTLHPSDRSKTQAKCGIGELVAAVFRIFYGARISHAP